MEPGFEGRSSIHEGRPSRVIGSRRSSPDAERAPEPDASERWAVAGLAFAVSASLFGGLATGWAPLLLVHFVGQFLMVLVAGAMVWNDRQIVLMEKLLWWASFLLLAPVFVPVFAVRYVGLGGRTAAHRQEARVAARLRA